MNTDTSADDLFARSCFVIMPYGVRDVGTRRVNFDRIYEKIFKPAIRRTRVDGKPMLPIRADEAKHSRVLVLGMIQSLLKARLAIADVSTDNGNVYWELGMRHNAVRSGTVILRLKRRPIPFDIAPILVNEYADTPPDSANASVGTIAASLRATLQSNEVDSPAFIGARQLAVLNGAPRDAALLYSKAVELAPDQPLLFQRQGTLFLQSGDPELAEQSFLNVLAIDRANGDARRFLADVRQGRQPVLIGPDPLESSFLKSLVSKDTIFDPNPVASAADISILAGTLKRGQYQSIVHVVGEPALNVSPIYEVLSRHGFTSPYVAVDLPEVNRTVYTFDATAPNRTQLKARISGLAQDLRSVPGVGKIDVDGPFGGGGGSFGSGGLGGL